MFMHYEMAILIQDWLCLDKRFNVKICKFVFIELKLKITWEFYIAAQLFESRIL